MCCYYQIDHKYSVPDEIADEQSLMVDYHQLDIPAKIENIYSMQVRVMLMICV